MPKCSKEARKAKINPDGLFLVVVGTDGLVHDVSVSRPVDYGMEEAAAKSVKEWRFKPATSSGNPAAVQIAIQLKFRCELM
jgi:TonB family protein